MANAKKTPDQLERERGVRIPSGKTPGTTAPVKPSGTKIPKNVPAQAPAQAAAPQTLMPPEFANWEEAAKELYGGYYAVVQSVPELQDLLKKAYENKWSDAQFDYALRQTAWYRQNSASAREWEIASQLDPASAQQSVDNASAFIRNKALTEFNVQLDQNIVTQLATNSIKFGWGDDLLSNAIGLEATRSTGSMSQLASGYVGQNIKEIANDYGIKLTEQHLNQWTASVATGQQTRDTFKQYAIQQAKQLFPSIATQLDAGQTFQQIVDPYRNTAANLLEMNANMIDFTDPKWAKAITFVDQSGNQRPMSFSEWNDYLRQNRSFGYEYTSDAQSKAYQVANDLANLFGKV